MVVKALTKITINIRLNTQYGTMPNYANQLHIHYKKKQICDYLHDHYKLGLTPIIKVAETSPEHMTKLLQKCYHED